jgi:ABC-type Zn uptake system ZnuABC Zn-binding protein ZnuA
LAAREGKSEYKKNCEALREEIAKLEARAKGGEFDL